MKFVKVKCPNCGATVKGEISTHLYCDHVEPKYVSVYYAECPECEYHIRESEWDEIKENLSERKQKNDII